MKKNEIIETSLIVKVITSGDAIEVLFDTGKSYLLNRAFLTDKCGMKRYTHITAAKSEMGGSELHILSSDGKTNVVPWDFILYHYEPLYKYYLKS